MSGRAEELVHAAAAFGVALTPPRADRLVRLAEMMLAANERIRLTAITEWREVQVKHLLDSLAPLALGFSPAPGKQAADLGSGGGFPGLVLAIARPECSFTLIESTQKKAAFLEEARAALGVANVAVRPERSEEAGRADGREAFDLVTARAVASLPVLVELAFPLLVVGGMLLAWKGPEAADEIGQAANALAKLGGVVVSSTPYALPLEMGLRTLVAIEKTEPTPASFPRRPGMAEKRPL